MILINTHGGDLELIGRKYNIPKEELINFGGNVNPLGISQNVKNALIENINYICQYPDVSYFSLKKSISNYTNVNADYIIPGNGATELISLFIKIISPKSAIIVSPSYSEYEREIKLNNGKTILFPLKEINNFKFNVNEFINFIPENTEMVIMCNPNNPTGTAVNIRDMEILLNYCEKKNIYVMIDETYIEFTSSIQNFSAVSLIPSHKNLFIVRGTAKFFAAPGLRLGYGICSDTKILENINSKKEQWSVNIFASIASEVMFSDKEYIEKTKKLIFDEREKITTELKKWKNIKVFETEANFILIKLLKNNITSTMVFENLIIKKMIIRDASNFAFLGNEYLRFCFLLPKQNKALLENMKTIIEV